jgi:hypothetical protein
LGQNFFSRYDVVIKENVVEFRDRWGLVKLGRIGTLSPYSSQLQYKFYG